MTESQGPSLAERLFVALQYPLPQHRLSRAVHWLTRRRGGALTRLAISRFVEAFEVDMREARVPDPRCFSTFNAFFTRALKPDARPMDPDPNALLCPSDGVISQFGDVRLGRLLQAKGHQFELQALLGGDTRLSQEFAGGSFATIYLSPRDYHRIHMPLRGRLRETILVPGRLFSVNQATARGVPRLFARNERLICVFDGETGPFALVLVGAIFVGSIETVWAGEMTPPRALRVTRRRYDAEDAPVLDAGAEMGRFNMGSTVILLLPRRHSWPSGVETGGSVRCRQGLGRLAPVQG